MHPLTYLYWNCNSLLSKLPELIAFLHPPPALSRPPASNRFSALHMADDSPVEEREPPPDLLGFAECKLDSHDELDPIREYTWLPFPQSARSGGLAFLVRSSLIHRARLDLSFNVHGAAFRAPARADASAAAASARNSAVVWLEVLLPNAPPCLYGLLYLHPNADQDDWRALADSLIAAKATGYPLFLMGDFNCRSADWGDSRELPSHHAEALSDLCCDLQWNVLNTIFAFGQITRPDRTQAGNGGGTVIDLAISSHSEWVRDLQVCMTGPLHSDHYPLRLTVDLARGAPPAEFEESSDVQANSHPAWNLACADWNDFALLAARYLSSPECSTALSHLRACPCVTADADHCRCALSEDLSPQQALDSAWNAFKACLLDAATLSLKVRRRSPHSKSWWSYPHGDLPTVYRAFRKALQRQRRFPNNLNRRHELAQRRRVWRAMQRDALRWNHEELCNAIQADPQHALDWNVWQKLAGKRKANPAPTFIVHPDTGELPADKQAGANHLALHFQRTCDLPPIPAASASQAAPAGVAYEDDAAAAAEEGKEEERKEQGEPAGPGCAARSDYSAYHRTVLAWLEEEGPSVAATRGPDSLQRLFTLKSLEEAADCAKPSSAGPDQIPVLFLTHGGRAVHAALLLLFNYSWVHGVLPLDWKSADAIPLYKGKGDPTLGDNHRPISLTSVVIRLFERLIHSRLYPAAERLQLLSAMQFGFRHHHGTQDALYVLLEWLKEVLCDPASPLGVPVCFLDLRKAYDRTWIEGVLKQLADGGITGRAWAWIRAFLTGRRFRVRAGGVLSLWELLFASVPQGAVLSPLLFAIFLNPILNLFTADRFFRPLAEVDRRYSQAAVQYPVIRIQLFADDIKIAPDTRCAGWTEVFQWALDEVEKFAAQRRLSFSLTGGKSAIVWFRGPYLRPDAPPFGWLRPFTLCGQKIEVVSEYKFLGVLLHETLSWEPHFKLLLRKAQWAACQVQALIPRLSSVRGQQSARVSPTTHAIGGPHFSAIRAMVLGCVYSRATYGCMFISGIGVEKMMLRLQSIVVRPLRQALGLPKSAHIPSVLVECDCPSLPLYRHQLLLSYARRCQLLNAAHPARLQLERSRRLHASLQAPRDKYSPKHPYTCVKDYCRPLLFDVLEAEQRFQTTVLRPLEEAQAAPSQALSSPSPPQQQQQPQQPPNPNASFLEIAYPQLPAPLPSDPSRAAVLYSDGAARGNPCGPSACGGVLYEMQIQLQRHAQPPHAEQLTPLCCFRQYLGRRSNNEAEYCGLLLGMEAALARGVTQLIIRMDSKLICQQLNGQVRVSTLSLLPLYSLAVQLCTRFREGVSVQHVFRLFNREADELANEAVEEALRVAAQKKGDSRPAAPALIAAAATATAAAPAVDSAPTMFTSTGHPRPPTCQERSCLLPELSNSHSLPPCTPGDRDAIAREQLLSLSLLARQRSFAEWQAEKNGGAILRQCKLAAGRSSYLYMEARGCAVLRSRLRFDRARLAQSEFVRKLRLDSPLCSFAPCRRRGEEETVEHALLHCPRLAGARQRCARQLRKLSPELQLSLPLLLGSFPPTAAQPARGNAAVAASAAASQSSLSSSVSPSASQIAAGQSASQSSVESQPRGAAALAPVWFRDDGLPRPSIPKVRPSERKAKARQKERAALFITQAFLRTLLFSHQGIL
jgi:ribonuclease HI